MATESERERKQIDNYLVSLGSRLRGLSSETSREIIEEIRSHITDKATINGELIPDKVDAALTALGSPTELAREYTTDDLLLRVEATRSPLRIMDSLFSWATFGSIGFLVLIGSAFGYFAGCALIACAALRPFHPSTAGLWRLPDGEVSLRMGFGIAPPGGRDMLGWSIIPLGLIVGCGLLTLTTRFALWCARQYLASRLRRRQS